MVIRGSQGSDLGSDFVVNSDVGWSFPFESGEVVPCLDGWGCLFTQTIR